MRAPRVPWLAAALLLVAALAAYANSFGVPFLFDDLPSVLDNPSIQHWSTAFTPPRSFGFTVSGRPLLNATLAANYAWGRFEVGGYHAVNFAIHVAAALVLFGLIRRTFRLPRLAPRLGAHADAAAFAVSLLWMLHPLQTEAVTYIIQRAESLMALMFLLTLYGFVRGVGDRSSAVLQPASAIDRTRAEAPRYSHGWLAFSFAACLAGVACKEVIALAPIVVLLYDRAFVAGDFRAAWRARRGYYMALFATWLPLLILIASVGGDRGGTFKFTVDAIARQWRGQCEAVLVYLKLVVWPAPLAIDYGPLHVDAVRLVACATILAALIGATAWALWRNRVAGFCGAFFFLILAPTSLMPGIVQTIVEHRMYLPLAAVLAFVIGGAAAFAGRRAIIATLVLALGAGVLTARRNADYRDDFALWRDTVAKRPGSALAQNGLGTAYFLRKKYPEALACYRAALVIDPKSAKALFNAGQALEALGQPAEALVNYRAAAEALANFPQAHSRIGAILESRGQLDEAETQLRFAIAGNPALAEAHNALGLVLSDRGRYAESIACYQAALKAQPDLAVAECNWGATAYRAGQREEARQHLQRALALQPKLAEAQFNLGLVFASEGHDDEARAAYAEAVRLKPDYGEARLNLGIALAQANRLDDSLGQLREAARLLPQRAEAHGNLGILLAEFGQLDEAIACYHAALRVRPDYVQAHYNLGNALVQQRKFTEARAEFAEAVRLAPGFAAAREMLDRFDAR